MLVDPACPGGAKLAIRKHRKGFCFLSTKSAGLVLLSWWSTVRLRDEVADAKLEQLWLCEEQNVLLFPITSYPPECFARGMYIKFSVSLPNLGHGERYRPTPVWWYADPHFTLDTSTVLQGVFCQNAGMLFHRYWAGYFLHCEKHIIFKEPLCKQ